MSSPAAPRPSVKDVASLAGVSIGTVSHVLNHPDRVTEATRQRVEEAIKELGFVRSETARRLRRGGSSLIGVLVHDIANPFFTGAARGIEDRLRADGLVPMLGSTDSDPDRERRLMEQLAGLEVRGVVVTPSSSTLDNLPVLTSRGMRVVLMDSPVIAAHSTVSGDDVAGARAAMAHLLGLGHRRVGLVNGPLSVRQAVDRRDGVVAAVHEAGLDVGDCLLEVEATVDGSGFTADAGAVGAARLLDEAEPPTTLLCTNDLMAIGAMREVRRRGLRIPEDVSIVGYDDIDIASELITPLTSVHVPMRAIGQAAADLLLAPDDDVRHVSFTPELVVRASTAAPA